jgi:glucuronokinase
MVTVARCSARAAVAGNPSDGYGGFVVATPVTSVSATVTVEDADRFEIVHSPTADDTFDDLASLVDHVDRFGMDDSRRLVLATLRALARDPGAKIAPVRVGVSTTIPRSVGLAGSSAIVIATVRALIAAHPNARWSAHLDSSPDQLAELALSAERDELEIAAGLQDRLVQSYGVPLAMDFSGPQPRSTPLRAFPGQLFVAARASSAEPSGVVHSDLRTRYAADIGATRSTVDAIAEQGRNAAAAITDGDAAALGAAMDRTLELRAELVPLDPELLAAAMSVRNLGGHANWTGSGGSILVMAADPQRGESIRQALSTQHDCLILDL